MKNSQKTSCLEKFDGLGIWYSNDFNVSNFEKLAWSMLKATNIFWIDTFSIKYVFGVYVLSPYVNASSPT